MEAVMLFIMTSKFTQNFSNCHWSIYFHGTKLTSHSFKGASYLLKLRLTV